MPPYPSGHGTGISPLSQELKSKRCHEHSKAATRIRYLFPADIDDRIMTTTIMEIMPAVLKVSQIDEGGDQPITESTLVKNTKLMRKGRTITATVSIH